MRFISELLEHPSLFAYFSGAHNYTWLQFRNGERRLLAKPLTFFEERLPSFIRVHKTVLVNPVCVVNVEAPPRPKMPGLVRMHDGTELPVSRRRWSEVSQLLQTHTDPVDSLVAAPSKFYQPTGFRTAAPLRLLSVMAGNALLVARDSVAKFGKACSMQFVESGAELATTLLLNSVDERPSLILLDARTNRADRCLTLQTLKSYKQLQTIPVIWLAAPDDDAMQAYAMGANSVVLVSDDPTSFGLAIEQLCRYWLMVVQPPLRPD